MHRSDSAQRVFLLCTALRWLPSGFLAPVSVLVPSQAGLALPAVGQMFAVYGLTTLLLELPTGGLADAVGRRPVIVTGAALDVLFCLTLLAADSTGGFLVAAVLGGAARALLSGPLEAWYVDGSRPRRTRTVRRGIGTAHVAESAALATGALLAALLAAVAGSGGATAARIPVVAAAVVGTAHLAAVALLVREPRVRRPPAFSRAVAVTATSLRTVRSATAAAVRMPDIRLLLGTAVLHAVCLDSVELFWQPRLAEIAGGPAQAVPRFGLLMTGVFAAATLGAAIGARAPDSRALLPGLLATQSGAVLLLATTTDFGVAGATFVTVYLLNGTLWPLMQGSLHDRWRRRDRATLLSAQSLAMQVGALVTEVLLARVAARAGIPRAWFVGALAGLGAAALTSLALRTRAQEVAQVVPAEAA